MSSAEKQPKQVFDLVVPCHAHDCVGLAVEKTADGRTVITVHVIKRVDQLELGPDGKVILKQAA